MTRIHDARDVHGVRSPFQYRVQHADLMAQAGRETWRAPGPLVMEIEHGRWIATCPHCRHRLTAWPEREIANCYTCGAIFLDEHIVWPADLDAIVQVLLVRPLENRHWAPSIQPQTLDDLIAENLAHDLMRPAS